MKNFTIPAAGPARERAVKAMYEYSPYPDLGADLKDPKPLLDSLTPFLGHKMNEKLSYLEAGCGTGHLLVGMAREIPHWKCHGVDLSAASLEIAGKLAGKHGVDVDLHCGSYLESLPFEEKKFDVVSAQGTVHHCEEPRRALQVLLGQLKPQGVISMHLYGWRLDREKFEIKEMLSILEPDLSQHQRRFELYQGFILHQRRWTLRHLLDLSPMDIFRGIRKRWRNWQRQRRRLVWSPPFTQRWRTLDAAWVDHFCHPCERAYEVPDVMELVEGSGLKIVCMRNQGKEEIGLLPPMWKEVYMQLPSDQKYRMMELLSPTARSFSMLLMREGDQPEVDVSSQ